MEQVFDMQIGRAAFNGKMVGTSEELQVASGRRFSAIVFNRNILYWTVKKNDSVDLMKRDINALSCKIMTREENRYNFVSVYIALVLS